MKKKKPTATPKMSYLPASLGLVVLVNEQEISAQALLDLAAIATPAPRPDWGSLMWAAADIQRRLAIGDWMELGLAVGVLVTDLGLQLDAKAAAELLNETILRTRRDGAQGGFCAIAHRLCVLAET